jgi:hypothetical protein
MNDGVSPTFYKLTTLYVNYHENAYEYLKKKLCSNVSY